MLWQKNFLTNPNRKNKKQNMKSRQTKIQIFPNGKIEIRKKRKIYARCLIPEWNDLCTTTQLLIICGLMKMSARQIENATKPSNIIYHNFLR